MPDYDDGWVDLGTLAGPIQQSRRENWWYRDPDNEITWSAMTEPRISFTYATTGTNTTARWYPMITTTTGTGTWGVRDMLVRDVHDVHEWGNTFTDPPAPNGATLTEAGERRRAETERMSAERATANSRATELLLMLLDENQRESFRQNRMFTLIGSHGTLYRIGFGHSGNVDWLKPDGSLGGRLCAHPTMRESWLPTADVVLSQVLALKTDEHEFCRVANVHYGTRPPIRELVSA